MACKRNCEYLDSFCPSFLSDFVTKQTVEMAFNKVLRIPLDERKMYLRLVKRYSKDQTIPMYYAEKLIDPFDPLIMKTVMEKIYKRTEVDRKNEWLPLIALELMVEYDRRHKIKERHHKRQNEPQEIVVISSEEEEEEQEEEEEDDIIVISDEDNDRPSILYGLSDEAKLAQKQRRQRLALKKSTMNKDESKHSKIAKLLFKERTPKKTSKDEITYGLKGIKL